MDVALQSRFKQLSEERNLTHHDRDEGLARGAFLQRGVPAVLVLGMLFLAAVLLQIPGLNGPWYWRWTWRQLPLLRAGVCFGVPLLAYGVLLWRWTRMPRPLEAAKVLPFVGGLVVCAALFQIAGTLTDPRGFALLEQIVLSPTATSYYTDAAKITDVAGWLADFHRTKLSFHSSTHPPGPILYYYLCIQLFGARWAPLIGSSLLGLLSCLGVALVYLLAGLWTADRYARLGSCFLYALLPALVLFFPEFDQVYPLISMLMLILWDRALLRSAIASVWLGLWIFFASFMAYNLSAMLIPMALYAFWVLQQARWTRAAVRATVQAGLGALFVAAAAHALLFEATSFSAISSLQRSLHLQAIFSGVLARPYGACLVFDLYDFALGGGVVLPLLALMYASAAPAAGDAAPLALTRIALLTILIVDLTGLLRCETARVWLFLQPLTIVPAGLQLAKLPPRERALLLTLQALILIALKCTMTFIMV